jgi:hypothetical protein
VDGLHNANNRATGPQPSRAEQNDIDNAPSQQYRFRQAPAGVVRHNMELVPSFPLPSDADTWAESRQCVRNEPANIDCVQGLLDTSTDCMLQCIEVKCLKLVAWPD